MTTGSLRSRGNSGRRRAGSTANGDLRRVMDDLRHTRQRTKHRAEDENAGGSSVNQDRRITNRAWDSRSTDHASPRHRYNNNHERTDAFRRTERRATHTTRVRYAATVLSRYMFRCFVVRRVWLVAPCVLGWVITGYAVEARMPRIRDTRLLRVTPDVREVGKTM
jgi:hypothetical protein